MSYHLSLEHIAEDALSRVTHRWWLDDRIGLALTLDTVLHESRPSKRHGWRIVAKWGRHNARDNTMSRPELTADLIGEARLKLLNELTFA